MTNEEEFERILDDPINRRIWDLKIRARRPYQAVADDVGLSVSAVWRRLKRITDLVPAIDQEEIGFYKRTELAQLEENEATVQAALLECARADHLGISRLTGSLLKIQQRRARLLGLDAPKRIEVDGLQTASIEDVFARTERGIREAEEHANQEIGVQE